jgi:alpha-L-arabinofuranosidase
MWPYLFIFISLISGSRADTLNIHIDTKTPTHDVSPLYMGCHSDSGFVHEVRGWSSQMIFGESFEDPQKVTPKAPPGQSSYAWQEVISPKTVANISSDAVNVFAGQASQRISITSGSGTAGLANRGLGNEGFYFVANKEYEGYLFASSKSKVTIEVRLENHKTGEVLASQRFDHEGGTFMQHNFSLTPTAGTECHGIAPGSESSVHCTNNPGTAHVCIECAGQFVVALVAGAAPLEANVDYVVLQPGDWGRFAGLNARKDVAETLQSMGIKAIRLGGSFCSVTADDGKYYQWERWTGPVWKRPSVAAHWDSYGKDAYNLIGGWGPFEMIDYAAALGAEPIITTTMTSSPAEFADLVEYCWGNETTSMGKKRIADGHPAQYKLRYIELGNEQYNPAYLDQVKAMEERAQAVGADRLHYIFPSNGGLNAADATKAAALKLGDRLATDIHVGAKGAIAVSTGLFAAHAKAGLVDDAAVNFETNAANHFHGRALDEAEDLNTFFNAGEKRMLARTASFCHGRAGHYDKFDQAISFFLPNMTWLQPPGHVHAMIHRTWQPRALNTTQKGTAPPVTPTWATVPDKSLHCSGSEYQGDLGVQATAADCLAGAQKNPAVNYAVYFASTTKQCYICSITSRGAPSTWKFADTPGAVSLVGTGIIQKVTISPQPPLRPNLLSPPLSSSLLLSSSHLHPTSYLPSPKKVSVSAQRSDDGSTVALRVVNHAASARDVVVTLDGAAASNGITSATAESLFSNDLQAENTAADVDNVAPKPLQGITTKGQTVSMSLPPSSFTIVVMKMKNSRGEAPKK